MNEPVTIAPIVEGDGEVYAIPELVRRICAEFHERYDIDVRKPWKLARGKMVKPGELAKVAGAVSRSVASAGGILIVLDLDDDNCAVDLANSLNFGDVTCRVEVVVAAKEYEAWFLGAVESLRAHRSVRDDASYQGNPESPRDAKGKLGDVMTEKYRETLHQVSFTSLFDLGAAQRASRSFRRMVSAVGRLMS